jgi:hypothetical protein
MTQHRPGECDPDTDDFRRADCQIVRLLDHFRNAELCPHCVARLLLLRGAHLLADIVGIENAAANIVELAAVVHERQRAATADSGTRH